MAKHRSVWNRAGRTAKKDKRRAGKATKKEVKKIGRKTKALIYR